MRRLATSEEGFGLVELLIAMTVMSIAIFALVAGFSSSAGTLNRASKTSTAGALADKQMEAFSAVGSITPCRIASATSTHDAIALTGPDGRNVLGSCSVDIELRAVLRDA